MEVQSPLSLSKNLPSSRLKSAIQLSQIQAFFLSLTGTKSVNVTGIFTLPHQHPFSLFTSHLLSIEQNGQALVLIDSVIVIYLFNKLVTY